MRLEYYNWDADEVGDQEKYCLFGFDFNYCPTLKGERRKKLESYYTKKKLRGLLDGLKENTIFVTIFFNRRKYTLTIIWGE